MTEQEILLASVAISHWLDQSENNSLEINKLNSSSPAYCGLYKKDVEIIRDRMATLCKAGFFIPVVNNKFGRVKIWEKTQLIETILSTILKKETI